MRVRVLTSRVLTGLVAVGLAGGGATSLARAAGLEAKAGDRVRVTAPSLWDKPVVGTLLASDGDTLRVLWDEGRNTVGVPRSRIETLEVSTGTVSHAAGGAMAGTAAGLLLAVALSNPPSSADHFQIDGPAMLLCGATGALSGALLGGLSRTERWAPVRGAQLSLAIAPVRGRGVAVAVRIRAR